MKVVFIVISLAARSSAKLVPCLGRAQFRLVADGGAHFEAEVHVARWQAGKFIQLKWSDNSVIVRPESVSEGATLFADTPTFRLESVKGSKRDAHAPGSFTFRADGLPSPPEVRCDLESLPALPPSPPPAPERCDASFKWLVTARWTGGFGVRLDIGSRGVPEGYVIIADFHTKSRIIRTVVCSM